MRRSKVFFALLSTAAVFSLAALAEIVHVPARLVASPSWHADVIVVPTGDVRGTRIAAAVDAFEAGRAPRLLITGTGQYEDSSAYLAQIAVARGVPQDRITLEERSLTTWENMHFSRPLLDALGARSVLLVTSRTHARRAALVAEEQWPGVEIHVVQVPEPSRQLRSRLLEIAKTLRYGLLGKLSWTRVLGQGAPLALSAPQPQLQMH